MQTEKPNPRSERAQSLVEFAVSATLMLMLLLGIMDLARAFFVYLTLRDAAQEGAVYGSICPENTFKIEQRARSASSVLVPLQDTAKVSVTCNFLDAYKAPKGACGVGTPAAGEYVHITVTFNNYEFITPFISNIVGPSITMRGDVSDVILRTGEPCP